MQLKISNRYRDKPTRPPEFLGQPSPYSHRKRTRVTGCPFAINIKGAGGFICIRMFGFVLLPKQSTPYNGRYK